MFRGRDCREKVGIRERTLRRRERSRDRKGVSVFTESEKMREKMW